MGEENSSWVVSFAQTKFFHGCPNHKFKDRKYYCYSCALEEEEALCEECATQNHKSLGHLVLQVRKTSHRDSIHVDDIKNLGVDLSYIQQMSINNHLAVYLRPKNGCNKSTSSSSCKQNGIININGSSKCDTCGSMITKVGSKFCSLACKVTHSSSSSSRRRRRATDDISSLDPTTILLVDQEFRNGKRRRRMVDDRHHDSQSKRKRRRKQKLPRRAPFL